MSRIVQWSSPRRAPNTSEPQEPRQLRALVERLFIAFAVLIALGAATPRTSAAQCSSIGWPISPCTSNVTVSPGGSGSKYLSVQNNTSESDGVNVSCAVTAPVTKCSVSPTVVSLAPNRAATLTVTYSVSATPGTGVVTISDDFGNSATINVTVPAAGPPVSAAPTVTNFRDPTLCVASCFDATYAYSTPAYTSLDVPRSITIGYRSSLAHAMGTVVLDATDTTTSGARQMSVKLWHNGSQVSFTNGTSETFFVAAHGNNRLAVQYDASLTPMGVARDSVVVTEYLNDGSSRTASVIVPTLILNESNAALGPGWTFVGLIRALVQSNGDVLVVDGSGAASLFKKPTGCAYACTFTAPNGEFRALTGPNQFNGTYALRSPDGVTATITSSGQVSSVADRFGNTTSYQYDPSTAFLTSITDPAGLVTSIGYVTLRPGTVAVQSITTPGGRVTRISVDTLNGLREIDNPSGQAVFRGDYAAGHYLTHYLDLNGSDWNVAYDAQNRLASITEPTIVADGGSVRPMIDFTSIESATMAAPGGGTSASPAAHVDTASSRATITNARGYTTAYKLDASGAPVRIEEPLGRTSVLTRDYAERVSQVTTPAGDQVTYSYTGPDLVATSDAYTGRTVRMDYEPTYHQVIRVYGDADSVWNYWSTAGRLDSTRTGMSTRPVASFVYDTRGRVVQRTTSDGTYSHVDLFYYSPTGWQNTDSARVADRVTSQTWNGWGLVSTSTDAEGHVTSYPSYDGLNRVLEVVGPRQDTTWTTYSGTNLQSVRDPMGQLYQYVQNALGWTTQEVDPRSASTYFGYDRDGNITATTNRRGQSITAAYDALDDMTSRTADGATTTYGTDPLGRYAMGTNSESADTVKYDPAGRMSSEVAVRSGVRYERTSTYDIRDRRTQVAFTSSPWGPISTGYHYDAMERLDTLTDMIGGKTVIAYDALDRPTSTVLPNGLSIGTPFANILRPTDLTYSDATVNSTVGASYAYGARGELTDRIAPSGTAGHEFDTDAEGQLTGYKSYTMTSGVCTYQQTPPDPPERVCTGPGKSYGASTGYGWDKVGNPTSNGAVTDLGNRLRQFGSDSLAYDPDGNLIGRYQSHALVQSLVWNSLGQLTSVTTNGTTVSFGYDAFGRRVRKTTPSDVLSYVHDGDNVWTIADNGGSHLISITAYYPGVDQPHSIFQGGAISYYLQDVSGNITGLVNSAKQLQNHYSYLPFGGADTTVEAVTNTLRFAAREYDAETGLYYLRARYYDPNLGRFVSEDPIGLDGGINPYVYSSNSPVDNSDASGRCPTCPPNGPPVPLPPGRRTGATNGWVNGGPDRPGGRDVWGPREPVPTQTGSQPRASWDEPAGHWDVDWGDARGRERFLPDGTKVDHDNKPVESTRYGSLAPSDATHVVSSSTDPAVSTSFQNIPSGTVFVGAAAVALAWHLIEDGIASTLFVF